MSPTRVRRCGLVAAAATAIALPAALSAQAAVRPMTFGVQGGFTLPMGEYGDVAETGFNVGGYLQWRPANQVFGVRGELQYHRTDIKDEVLDDFSADATGNFSLLYIGVAPVLEVAPAESSIGWYVLAGVGLYQVKTSVTETGIDVSASQSEIGFNAGAGLRFRFGSASLYVETRYHGVRVDDDDATTSASDFNFMPFSIGISW
jgi:opacity protein-like surface antigen